MCPVAWLGGPKGPCGFLSKGVADKGDSLAIWIGTATPGAPVYTGTLAWQHKFPWEWMEFSGAICCTTKVREVWAGENPGVSLRR